MRFFLSGCDFDLAEALAQIHHGDDLAAEIDDAFDGFGSARDGSDLGNANDFAHRSDTDAERLVADAKPDDLKVFVLSLSWVSGARELGVFAFRVAMRLAAARV